jgi:hypothetical protein
MDHDRKKFDFWKYIPLMSLCIGLTAFLFQIFVLYPWHLELSADFAKLASRIN